MEDEFQINEFPSVTVAIPVLNEEKHIRRVVEAFLRTEYPNLIEVLIADGGSSDRTREIVKELSSEDARVKLVENPKKYQSYGLNRMIEVAEGDIFLRADGHCHYHKDYIEKCVSVMLKTGARNVGGAQRYMAKNRVQAGIALAVKSILGNGGAKYMNENFLGYADTVFLGCFKTSDLREIGGFNTENVTNQDSELNLRLIEKFGPTVYISPEIKSWYYPRDSFVKLFKQYFRYGRGRFLTRTLHPRSSPIRGMVPFLSILILVVYSVTDAFTDSSLYSFQILTILALILIVESMRLVIVKKECFKEEIWNSDLPKPGYLSNLIATTISLILMQFGHFFGFLYQLIKSGLRGKKGW
ncbi:MAG: glycosyltransferase family 2 protein [Cyanothece sp. SIO1E1]|nr:glycosyltransferase family 2 protein [Cyanothece sp. SIO1E1]